MTTAKWPTIRVSELVSSNEAEIKTGPFGTQLKASSYIEVGTPVINVRNIGFGDVRKDNLEFIGDETVKRLSSHLLRQEDIVFGRKGAVERHAFIRNAEDRWFQGSDCLRLRLKSPHVLPRFVSYFLLTREHQEWMLQQGSHGATMASLNQDIVGRIEFPLPDINTQRRIASILSAYDDLIENNTRRIAILEEMARRIYEEWFVRFRFPGHEKVRMVESEPGSVPEGWGLTTLASVCVPGDGIQTGPFGSQLHKADYSDEGVPVLMPKNLVGFRIETDGIARIPEVLAERLVRHRVKPGDIVYGRRGDIGRRAYIMSDQAGWFCGTGCLRIRPNPKEVNGWYLFNFIGQDNVVGLIAGRAHGVTMPNLNAKLMESIPVVRPPREIQDRYEEITFPMTSLREKLSETSRVLRATRDLLLPRLISGELDVSELPEPESAAA